MWFDARVSEMPMAIGNFTRVENRSSWLVLLNRLLPKRRTWACNSMSVLLLNQSPFLADVEVTVDKDAAFPELFPINFFSVVHS